MTLATLILRHTFLIMTDLRELLPTAAAFRSKNVIKSFNPPSDFEAALLSFSPWTRSSLTVRSPVVP